MNRLLYMTAAFLHVYMPCRLKEAKHRLEIEMCGCGYPSSMNCTFSVDRSVTSIFVEKYYVVDCRFFMNRIGIALTTVVCKLRRTTTLTEHWNKPWRLIIFQLNPTSCSSAACKTSRKATRQIFLLSIISTRWTNWKMMFDALTATA